MQCQFQQVPRAQIHFQYIYNCLINTPSPVTKEEPKAYKSMEGHPCTYTMQPAG